MNIVIHFMEYDGKKPYCARKLYTSCDIPSNAILNIIQVQRFDEVVKNCIEHPNAILYIYDMETGEPIEWYGRDQILYTKQIMRIIRARIKEYDKLVNTQIGKERRTKLLAEKAYWENMYSAIMDYLISISFSFPQPE